MKLFYSPGACSLAPHIVAREAGIAIEIERVNLVSKRCAGGANFTALNPKGYVPALLLDDGELLTEGPVISQFLADLAPQAALLPPVGSRERYRVLSWLGYVNSELHKSYSPLFKPTTPEDVRDEYRAYLLRRYQLIELHLAGAPFLGGEHFGIADAYLFVVSNWASHVGVDLGPMPALQAFMRRCAERPAVIEALRAEGLLSGSRGS
ncbi:MAG: glutathione transferase GstA [Pseudomarimonas sp.]